MEMPSTTPIDSLAQNPRNNQFPMTNRQTRWASPMSLLCNSYNLTTSHHPITTKACNTSEMSPPIYPSSQWTPTPKSNSPFPACLIPNPTTAQTFHCLHRPLSCQLNDPSSNSTRQNTEKVGLVECSSTRDNLQRYTRIPLRKSMTNMRRISRNSNNINNWWISIKGGAEIYCSSRTWHWTSSKWSRRRRSKCGDSCSCRWRRPKTGRKKS
jgi:hypothetical protein